MKRMVDSLTPAMRSVLLDVHPEFSSLRYDYRGNTVEALRKRGLVTTTEALFKLTDRGRRLRAQLEAADE